MEAPIVQRRPRLTVISYGAPTYLCHRDLLLDCAPLQKGAHDSLPTDPKRPERSGRAEFRRTEDDHLAFRDTVEPVQERRHVQMVVSRRACRDS